MPDSHSIRSITLTCPNPRCGLVLSVPDHVQGQTVKCAGCGHRFTSPPPELHLGKPRRRRIA